MLSRRHMLSLVGAATLGPFCPGTALRAMADLPMDRRMVLVILRGGLDGLAAVPPYGDPGYREARGALALPEPAADGGVLDLDGRFALHPALKTAHALYRAGELTVVHAAATPHRGRSHFDGQDALENGTDRPGGARDGWLNRVLRLFGADGRRRGLAVGGAVPLVLEGEVPVRTWAPQELPSAPEGFLETLGLLYGHDRLLGPALAEAIDSDRMMREILGSGREARRARGGRRAFGAAMTAAGRLLADADGPRLAVLDAGGWDTHSGQGTIGGRLAGNLDQLDKGIRALKEAMAAAWRETAVLVVTEFGRTVAPNRTGGTDHGTAGAAFLFGGAVDGGRVVGRWPGLSSARLYEGRDLVPTTDLRSLFKGVLVEHLGLPVRDVEARVFPASGGAPPIRELIRA